MNELCGIYCIENTVNGKGYVGQAVSLRARWKDHKVKLRGNRHYNRHLQLAWNKYGEKAFKFYSLEIIEYTGDNNQIKLLLSERETYYINLLQTTVHGYNYYPTGGSPLGYKHDEEFKRKCSEINKNRHQDPIYHNKHKKAVADGLKRVAKNLERWVKHSESIKRRSLDPIGGVTRKK